MNYFKRKRSKEPAPKGGMDLSNMLDFLYQAQSDPSFYQGMQSILAAKKERAAFVSLLENDVSDIFSNFELMYTYMEIVEKTFEAAWGTQAMLRNLVRFFFYTLEYSKEIEAFDTFEWESGEKIELRVTSVGDMREKAINVKKIIDERSRFPLSFLLSELKKKHISMPIVVHVSDFSRGFLIPKGFVSVVGAETQGKDPKKVLPAEFFLIKIGFIARMEEYYNTLICTVLDSEDLHKEYLVLVFSLAIDPEIQTISELLLNDIVSADRQRVAKPFLEFLAEKRLRRREYEFIRKRVVLESGLVEFEGGCPALLRIIGRQITSARFGGDRSAELEVVIAEAERRIKLGKGSERLVEFLTDLATSDPEVQAQMIEAGVIERVFVTMLALLRPFPKRAVKFMEVIISGQHKRESFVARMQRACGYKSLLTLIGEERDPDTVEGMLCVFKSYLYYNIAGAGAVTNVISLLNESVSERNIALSTAVLKSITRIITEVPQTVPVITEHSGFLVIMNSIAIYKTLGSIDEEFLRHSVVLLMSVARSSREDNNIRGDIVNYVDTVFPEITKDNYETMILLAYDFSFLDSDLSSLRGLSPPSTTEYLEVGRRILYPEILDWALKLLFRAVKELDAGEFAERLIRHLWLHVQLNNYNQKVLQNLDSLVFILDELKRSIFYGEPSEVYSEKLILAAKYLLLSGNKKMLTERILGDISNPSVSGSQFTHLINLLADVSNFSSEPSHFEFSPLRSGSKPRLIVRSRVPKGLKIDQLTLLFHFKFENAKTSKEGFRIFSLQFGSGLRLAIEMKHSNMHLSARNKKQAESLSLEDYTFEARKLYFVVVTLESIKTVNLYVNGVHKQVGKFSSRVSSSIKNKDTMTLLLGAHKTHKYSIGTFMVSRGILDRETIFRLYLLPPNEFNYFRTPEENGNWMNKMDAFVHTHFRSIRRGESQRHGGAADNSIYPCVNQYRKAAGQKVELPKRPPRETPLLDISKLLFLVDSNVDDRHRKIHNLLNFDDYVGEYDPEVAYYPFHDISKSIDKYGGLAYVLSLMNRSTTFESLFSSVKLFTRYVERTNNPTTVYNGIRVNAYRILAYILSKKAKEGIPINVRIVYFLMVHFGVYPLKTRLSVVRYSCGIREFVSSVSLWKSITNKAREVIMDSIILFLKNNEKESYNAAVFKRINLVSNLLNTIFDLLGKETEFSTLASVYSLRQILQLLVDDEIMWKVRKILLFRLTTNRSKIDLKDSSIISVVMKEIEGLFHSVQKRSPERLGMFSRSFDLQFFRYFCENSESREDIVSAFRLFSLSNMGSLMKIRERNRATFDEMHRVYLPRSVDTVYEVQEVMFMLVFDIPKGKASVLKPEHLSKMSIKSPYYVLVLLGVLFAMQENIAEERDVHISKLILGFLGLLSESVDNNEVFSVVCDSTWISFLSLNLLCSISSKKYRKEVFEYPDYRMYLTLVRNVISRALYDSNVFMDVLNGLFAIHNKDCGCPELCKEHYANLFTEITNQVIIDFSRRSVYENLDKVDPEIVKSFEYLTQVFKHLISSQNVADVKFKYLLFNIELLKTITNSYNVLSELHRTVAGDGPEFEDAVKRELERRVGNFFGENASSSFLSALLESLHDALYLLMGVSIREQDAAIPLATILLSNAGYFLGDSVPKRREFGNRIVEFIVRTSIALLEGDSDTQVPKVLDDLWKEVCRRVPESATLFGSRNTDVALVENIGKVLAKMGRRNLEIILRDWVSESEKFFSDCRNPPFIRPTDDGSAPNIELKNEISHLREGYLAYSLYQRLSTDLYELILSMPKRSFSRERDQVPLYERYPEFIDGKEGFGYLIVKLLMDNGEQAFYLDPSVEVQEPDGSWAESMLVLTDRQVHIYSYHRNPLLFSRSIPRLGHGLALLDSELEVALRQAVGSHTHCVALSMAPKWREALLCSFSNRDRLDTFLKFLSQKPGSKRRKPVGIDKITGESDFYCVNKYRTLMKSCDVPYTVIHLRSVYGPDRFLQHIAGTSYISFVEIVAGKTLSTIGVQVLGDFSSVAFNPDEEILVVTYKGVPGVVSIFEFNHRKYGLCNGLSIRAGPSSTDYISTRRDVLFLLSVDTLNYCIFSLSEQSQVHTGSLSGVDFRGSFTKDPLHIRLDPGNRRVFLFLGYSIAVLNFDGSLEARHVLQESWGNRIVSVSNLFAESSFILGHRDGSITFCDYSPDSRQVSTTLRKREVEGPVEFVDAVEGVTVIIGTKNKVKFIDMEERPNE